MAIDAKGDAYVTGYSFSSNFPLRGGLKGLHGGAVLAKFGSEGSLIYSTFPGPVMETGAAVAVDGTGAAYVTGSTQVPQWVSPDEATWSHVFIAKVLRAGNKLAYTRVLGGSRDDFSTSIAVTHNRAVVTGATSSANWPTRFPIQPRLAGEEDAFVVALDKDGRVDESTYLGSSGDNGGEGVSVDASGAIEVTGFSSGDFPIRHEFTQFPMEDAAFVLRLDPTARYLEFSTLLGGSGQDSGWGIAAHGAGSLDVVGSTEGRLPDVRDLIGSGTTQMPSGFLVEIVTKSEEGSGGKRGGQAGSRTRNVGR